MGGGRAVSAAVDHRPGRAREAAGCEWVHRRSPISPWLVTLLRRKVIRAIRESSADELLNRVDGG
jgi:hypothetical protein